MSVSRLITGIIMTAGGFVLLVVSLTNGFKEVGFVALIYGVPILFIGIIILLNKKEDKIEQIKSQGGKK